jgi:hypothetical protein
MLSAVRVIRHFPCCMLQQWDDAFVRGSRSQHLPARINTSHKLTRLYLKNLYLRQISEPQPDVTSDISYHLYPPKLTPQNCTLLDTCLRCVLGELRSTAVQVQAAVGLLVLILYCLLLAYCFVVLLFGLALLNCFSCSPDTLVLVLVAGCVAALALARLLLRVACCLLFRWRQVPSCTRRAWVERDRVGRNFAPFCPLKSRSWPSCRTLYGCVLHTKGEPPLYLARLPLECGMAGNSPATAHQVSDRSLSLCAGHQGGTRLVEGGACKEPVTSGAASAAPVSLAGRMGDRIFGRSVLDGLTALDLGPR